MSNKLIAAARAAARSDRPNVTVLSLGAGVQSTTLALLAAEGELPRPDAAIFADTGWEPRAVYEHLERLKPVLTGAGIPVRVVQYGDIRTESIQPNFWIAIPLFVKGERSDKGMLRRQCTTNYKLVPIHREIRRMLGGRVTDAECRYCGGRGRRIAPPTAKRGQAVWGACSVCRGSGQIERVSPPPAGRWVEQWIGFSTDEVWRVSDRSASYIRMRYPLLDLGMSRDDCREWLTSKGWEGVPKSACVGCPFHGNAQWRDLRDNQPEDWADAVEMDAAIRHLPGTGYTERIEGFLHSDRVPLDQADIDDESKDADDPIGCSPYGCRADQAGYAPQEPVKEDEDL